MRNHDLTENDVAILEIGEQRVFVYKEDAAITGHK
jgi:hypothetical protein